MSDHIDTGTNPRARTSSPPLRSPLTSIHSSSGAAVTTEGGAEVVRSYGHPDRERAAVEKGIGVADITVRAKIDVRGDVNRALTPASQDVVAKIAGDWSLLFSPPGSATERVAAMQTAAGTSAMVTDVTHLYTGFALAGPSLPDALARLTAWDPSTLDAGTATGAPIADVRAIVLRREASVPLLEFWVATEFARYVWRSVLQVVERLGGGPVGWDALREQGWR